MEVVEKPWYQSVTRMAGESTKALNFSPSLALCHWSMAKLLLKFKHLTRWRSTANSDTQWRHQSLPPSSLSPWSPRYPTNSLAGQDQTWLVKRKDEFCQPSPFFCLFHAPLKHLNFSCELFGSWCSDLSLQDFTHICLIYFWTFSQVTSLSISCFFFHFL